MEDVSPLVGSELFSSLGAEALARVAVKASTLRLERNDALFNEGDQADELFVVLTGRIAIAKRSTDGRESLVALMEPGDIFGEMPLFDDEPAFGLSAGAGTVRGGPGAVPGHAVGARGAAGADVGGRGPLRQPAAGHRRRPG